jgi:hypothetical protein
MTDEKDNDNQSLVDRLIAVLLWLPWANVLERVHQDKEDHLRWGRDTLGWAIYVFKKSGRES